MENIKKNKWKFRTEKYIIRNKYSAKESNIRIEIKRKESMNMNTYQKKLSSLKKGEKDFK